MHPPDLPVPAADLVHACAHELITCQEATGHVKRHLETAQTAASPAFDFEHADRHLDELTLHLNQLIANLGFCPRRSRQRPGCSAKRCGRAAA